jgi:pteridine reductase
MNSAEKVALVTGAGRRVGRAIALELARAGCHVAVHYRSSEEAAREVREEIEKLGRRSALVRGDLGDPAIPQQLIREAVAQLGRLDVLVNSASTFDKRPLADSDPAFWSRTLQVNVVAPALLARAAAPHMQAAGAGRIVNMADILAERPPREYAAYVTSKAALVGLTRALARELAPTITVNAIAPGIAEFPDDCDQATRDALVARVPLKRPGTPEEVAALVRFLVITGDYITGQIIRIDGGRSIRP